MYRQGGYQRLYVNKEVQRLDDLLASTEPLPDAKDIYIVVDRLIVSAENDQVSRLVDSAETAMYEGNGTCVLVFIPSNLSYEFSTRFEADGITFEEPNDNMFSFNSPVGACPTCEGFGSIIGIDEKLVIPNSTLRDASNAGMERR